MSIMNPIVSIKNGQLRGSIIRSSEGFSYCAFKGIPYARPPVKVFRFKDPEPFTESWTGIRDARTFGNICLQYDTVLRMYCGSDDCLYLNVYVKSIQNFEVLKPVMVYIHGGAYHYGSGDDTMFGPDYLLRKDIVLVTFNYRLGIFGFLNLDYEYASGNQGLKDQVMALRWVQENIKNFGGDPNNVTIFGESVGGVSVHYLALSPMSKGLFHKIICQSGSIFNPFALIEDTKENVLKLCRYLNEYSDDPEDILEVLRLEEGFKIVEAQNYLTSLVKARQFFILPFGPVIDSISPNPFMPSSLEKAASNGIQVPCILGYNSREGIGALIDHASFTEITDKVYEELDKNFSRFFDPKINILKRYNLSPDDLKQIYFKDGKITKASRKAFANFYGDLYIVEGIQRAIKIQATTNSAPTYVYKFSFNNDQSLYKSKLVKPMSGACHFDEVEYIFYNNLRRKLGLKVFTKGTVDHKVMERMIEMWTTFATYGSPTSSTPENLPVEWQPLNSSTDLNYLNIDKELHVETAPYLEQFYINKTQIDE